MEMPASSGVFVGSWRREVVASYMKEGKCPFCQKMLLVEIVTIDVWTKKDVISLCSCDSLMTLRWRRRRFVPPNSDITNSFMSG